MDMLSTTVLETIQNNDLFQKGDTVLVALSGGADSVALLQVMLRLRETLSLSEICALHMNHGIRGDSADRDEHFVQTLCNSLSVPLTIARVDVLAEVKKTGESVEDAARRLRYAFFKAEAKRFSKAKIVTAHTADDQAETVILHLIRGSGLKGAAGIPMLRGNIVRPLLECTAKEVRSFCKANGFSFVIDETNSDLRYSRNRVRHEILPLMRQINPAVDRAFIRFARMADENDRFLTSCADTLLSSAQTGESSFSVSVLLQADPAVRMYALYQVCQAEYTHIVRLNDCLKGGGTVNLPNDRSAISDGDTLRFVKHTRLKSSPSKFFSVPVKPDEEIDYYGTVYIPRVISYEEYKEKSKIHKNLFYFCISYDMIEHDLVLRSRKDGDRLRPYGRGCTKTLKKLMNDRHIPSDRRMLYPILANDNGILMVMGLCVDETVAVTPLTKYVLWFDILHYDTASQQAQT